MLKGALSWIGLLAVLALAGFGAGALALVKDRIHVTIQSDDASTAPDPLALVRDELDQVHTDLRAIAEGLDVNLRRVGEALEDNATRVDSIAAAAERRPAATFDDAARRELAALRTELSVLRAALVARSTAVAAPAPMTTDATAESATSDEAAAASLQEVAAATPEPPADTGATPEPDPETAATPPKPAKRGFLSFKLPSAGFAFDAPSRYRILPSLSRVGFDAKSTLHDFTGVTSDVRGEIDANLGAPGAAWTGTIRCKAAALTTGLEDRDTNMLEHLGAEEHPEITFQVARFVPDENGVDVDERTARGRVEGRMTIHGKSHDVAMPVEISVDESQRVVVSGQMPLRLPDYEVPVPNKLGLISMEEEVNVWIELRARATGAAEAEGAHGH